MVEPQTSSDVIKSLEQEGYTESFKTNKNRLRAITNEIYIDPEDLIVDKIYRFEGETNLSDEEIIFVVTCPRNHIKGIFLVAYGPMMDPADAAIVQRLQRKFSEKKTTKIC